MLPWSHLLTFISFFSENEEWRWNREGTTQGEAGSEKIAFEDQEKWRIGPRRVPFSTPPTPFPHLPNFHSSPRAGTSTISEWKPFVKSCVGNEMPAHGRQWLWRNHGMYTHLACLWFASLISSPGHRGVSPQAYRSGFCIIHISPSFYFICFFHAAFPLFLNIWVKKM